MGPGQRPGPRTGQGRGTDMASFWEHIRRGWNEGRERANRKFEAEHGHKPEETINRGWEWGKTAARDGKGIKAAMSMSGNTERVDGMDTEQQITDRLEFVTQVVKELDQFDSINAARQQYRDEYQILSQARLGISTGTDEWQLYDVPEDEH